MPRRRRERREPLAKSGESHGWGWSSDRPGRRSCLLAAIASVCLGACATSAPPSPAVARADFSIQLARDGTLDIHEQFELTSAAVAPVFERRVLSDAADMVTLTGAAVDGRTVTPKMPAIGRAAATGEALQVMVPLPGSGSFRVELRFRATGALRVNGPRGTVDWPVIRAPAAWALDEAHITFSFPEGATEAGPTGVLEPGWTVARIDRGITASRTGGVQRATVHAEIYLPAAVPEPVWQTNEALRRDFALAFATGSAFVIVIGAGVLVLMQLQYRVARSTPSTPAGPRELGLSARGDERLSAFLALRSAGVAGAAFALVCAAAAALWLPRFGWWAQVIPGSLLLVAAVFYVRARFALRGTSPRSSQ